MSYFSNEKIMSDMHMRELKNNLCQICPIVRLPAENGRNPFHDWELFDWVEYV